MRSILKHESAIMIRRTHVVILTIAAMLSAFAGGGALFLPALKLLFAGWFKKLAASSGAETSGASDQFRLAFSALCALVPFSALVTERGGVRAKYSHALAKSLLVGMLAFCAALLYHHQLLASRERLALKMPQLLGETITHLADNPLTKIVWFTTACLAVFGPVDLWIAHFQKKSGGAAPNNRAKETQPSE